MHTVSMTRMFCLALLLGFASPVLVFGRPAHKQALIAYFGPSLPARLHSCQLCHLPEKGSESEKDSDKPHNPFGARLKAIGAELRKAGQPADLPARLRRISTEDSDGDGVSNILELLSGHHPGDPGDKPNAAELNEASQELLRFETRLRETYTWAPFAPVRRPALPTAEVGKGRNPVDVFLQAAQKKHELTPRPEAPPHVLLRRLYLDLIGLPPTREEVDAFLADRRPDAYERVVERLLASPAHGERWGRHWMDVWRYADWAGYGAEVRDSQKHIWHWRDWIIESLNADKGYDRMVQEMLAADELAPTDADALRATGFLVRNWFKFNRNIWLERAVEHTGKAFLGVTLNCARCHDHFFDPITQPEYYAFRALFEPHSVRTDRLPGQFDVEKDGLPRVYDAQLTAPTFLFTRGDEANPDKSKPISPGVPAVFDAPFAIEAIKLPRAAFIPERQPAAIAATLANSQAAVESARSGATLSQRRVEIGPLASLAAHPLQAILPLPFWQRVRDQAEIARLNLELAEARHAALVAVLRVEELEEEKSGSEEWKQAALNASSTQRHVALLEARHAVRAAEVDGSGPGGVAKLNAARANLARVEMAGKQPLTTTFTRRNLPSYPTTSTGRRLALAKWLTHRDNPLAARVAVNHVWLRHFGKALVPTEFDFGKNGQPPTHPALLDWLAAEFMESGWSMKALHRLMVTSEAYRRDSNPDPTNLVRDPDNRHLWRMNSRRMEGEVVRDSLLHVAGALDRTPSGPELDHHLGLTIPRRSLYFRHAAEKQMEFLMLFDAASVNECYRRSESIVPQQALALANSSLALNLSRQLARTLSNEVGPTPSSHDAFVKVSFRQVLGRAPSGAELAACLEFLGEQTVLLTDRKKLTPVGGPGAVAPAIEPHLRAREGLIQVLLNHHEFVTIR